MNWLINIASNYLRFAVSLVVMALLTPYMISNLGTDLYGLWVLVQAAIGLIGLSDLGFATAAVKFIAEQQGRGDIARRNQLVGSLLLTYAFIGLGCALLVAGLYLLGGAPGDRPEAGALFLLLGMSTALSLSLSVFRAAIIAAGRQGILNLVSVVLIIAQALASWWVLANDHGIMGVALVSSLGLVLQALACIPLCLRLLPQFAPVLHHGWRQDMKAIAGFSCWAFIANAAVMVILRIDPFVVSALEGLQAVAMLGIALKIAEQVLLFNKQFSNALMPLISQHHGRGDSRASGEVFILGTRYLLAFATPFVLLIAVSSETLVRAWVGDIMLDAAPVLMVLCLAAWFTTLQFNAANLLGMTGHARRVALTMLASAVAKIGICLAAYPAFGLMACALGTLVGALVFECNLNLRGASHACGLRVSQVISQAAVPALASCLPFVIGVYLINDAFDHSLPIMHWLGLCALAGLASLSVFALCFVSRQERATLLDSLGISTPLTDNPEMLPCKASVNS